MILKIFIILIATKYVKSIKYKENHYNFLTSIFGMNPTLGISYDFWICAFWYSADVILAILTAFLCC